MSKKKLNAKREAYQKKQEQQGKSVVNWIFGILVGLAVLYLVYLTLSLA